MKLSRSLRFLCLVAGFLLAGCVTSGKSENLEGPATDKPQKTSSGSSFSLGDLFGGGTAPKKQAVVQTPARSLEKVDRSGVGFLSTPPGSQDEIRVYYDINTPSRNFGKVELRRVLPPRYMLLTSVPFNARPKIARDFDATFVMTHGDPFAAVELTGGRAVMPKERYAIYAVSGGSGEQAWSAHMEKRYRDNCPYRFETTRLAEPVSRDSQQRVISTFTCKAESSIPTTLNGAVMRLTLNNASVHLLFEWAGSNVETDKKVAEITDRWLLTEICQRGVAIDELHGCGPAYEQGEPTYNAFCGYVTELTVYPADFKRVYDGRKVYKHWLVLPRASEDMFQEIGIRDALVRQVDRALASKPNDHNVFRIVVDKGTEASMIGDSVGVQNLTKRVVDELGYEGVDADRISFGVNPSCNGNLTGA